MLLYKQNVRQNGTPSNMHAIEQTYVSLLADVASLTGFSEIRGSYEGLHWCLNEAPQLEKYVLKTIESGQKLDEMVFPIGLRRLAVGSQSDPIQLRYLRQLLLFCYKALVTHDKDTTEKTFGLFIQTNSEVGSFGNSLSRLSPTLLNLARRHVQSVLYRFRAKEIFPSHGPGAVTTSKERWQNCYSTIEALYPFSDWFCLQNRHHQEQMDECDFDREISAKVIAVPKDSRGPRLICVHPAEAIWIQQGLRRELERVISRPRTSKGPWPHGHIFFDDQSVNGRIALLSSRSRRYATLDMKEASDRISEPLVQVLFGSLYKYFGCCRAQKYEIPNQGNPLVGDIHSYAPMGNATTFPVQSLVFWAICVASMQYRGFHQPGAVFVFGDDIIVPSECAEAVIDDLESFGLLVNRNKSFWRGAFRESCGVDAFNGVNVTPVRWKTTIDAEHTMGLQSLSDLGMRLRTSGYLTAACTVYSLLRSRLWSRYGRRLFITNNLDHGGIVEFVPGLHSLTWRDAFWYRSLQLWCSPVWRLESRSPLRSSSDWNHVLESVCSLERTGRAAVPVREVPRPLRLKRGWIAVR